MSSHTATDSSQRSELERRTIRKISLKLMPFLTFGYFIAHVDRNNVGIASLQMNDAIGLTSTVFGLGSSLFFLAYVLLEVPSNLMLAKVGARLWIARILITWGIIATAMAFVIGPFSFTAMRILLGAAEAGFFPGIILYLTYWFPPRYRARNMALFSIAIPLSNVLGSIIGGLLLRLSLFGLEGWQWLFIVEGLPAVILGVMAFKVLPNGPMDAKWLSDEERTWLTTAMSEQERTVETSRSHTSFWTLFTNGRIMLLALVYTSTAAISQGLSLWQPQIIKSFGLTDSQVGLVNAIPFAVATILMYLWGKLSDRRSERVLMTLVPTIVAAISLAFVPNASTIVVFIIVICGVLVGTYAAKGPFWSLSSEWLSRKEAVAGIAIINSIGSLAAFGNNILIGFINDRTGSFALSMVPLMVLSISSVLLLVIGSRRYSASVSPQTPTQP